MLPPRNSLFSIPVELRLEIFAYLFDSPLPLLVNQQKTWQTQWEKLYSLVLTNLVLNQEITQL
jgi:hypothetical protein